MARRRKKKTETEEPARDPNLCRVPDCPHPVMVKEGFCYFHFLLDKSRAYVEKSFSGGQITFENLLGLGGAAIAQRVLSKVMTYNPQGGFNPQQQQTPRPSQPNGKMTLPAACAVLGLDPRRMTADDVRTFQRELAKLYHPDRCGKGVAAAKMKEINAAAEVCLEHVRARGG